MEPLYTVYFGGEVLPGQEPQHVRVSLGQLFKVDDATLDRLFNGRLHVLKRDCDKATALKYKQAMERAGARPVIKPAAQTPAQPAEPTPQTARQMSAAERIAALASAPDLEGYRSDTQSAADTAPRATTDAEDGSLDLSPPASDVLRPEERTPPVQRDIDTGSLAAEQPGERLSAEPAATPPPPDVSHLSLGAAGETIPTLAGDPAPPAPDTDRLALSPAGTDFSDCAAPEPAAPALDLSDIALAPAGASVLEDRYRRKDSASIPATDHLQLEE